MGVAGRGRRGSNEVSLGESGSGGGGGSGVPNMVQEYTLKTKNQAVT